MKNGAMTLSIVTFSLMAFNIKTFNKGIKIIFLTVTVKPFY
jgi:hypothetical protein